MSSGKNRPYVSIETAAQMLQVSTATIRNWTRTGVIPKPQSVNGRKLYDRTHIQWLRKKIENGDSHKLKSRRNKKAYSGRVLPVHYVDAPILLKAAEQIIAAVQNTLLESHPRMVLLEIILHYLLKLKRIEYKEISDKWSRLEQVLNHPQGLGHYSALLQQWLDEAASMDPEILKQLSVLRGIELPFLAGYDFLGLVHMGLTNIAQRKSSGSYYTSRTLANQLVKDSLAYYDEQRFAQLDDFPKVIDPCCGSGNFLLQLYLFLKNKGLQLGVAQSTVEKKLLTHIIYGCDIDPTAVLLSKINLLLHSESDIDPYLLQIRCCNMLQEYTSDRYPRDCFDMVIGNPPWGFSFSQAETEIYQKHFQVAHGNALESFDLFIEVGLTLLKRDGLLSYVLPESFLNVKLHRKTRKWVLDQTHILRITALGTSFKQVNIPIITLMLRKCPFSYQHGVEVCNGVTNRYVVQQTRFWKNEDHLFNISLTPEQERILIKMREQEGVFTLKGQAKFGLGIVTGNNREYVTSEYKKGWEPILKGSDIFKYRVARNQQYIDFKPERFQQTAPEMLYRAPEKLIYRFINESLIFAYDDEGTLSLNSANILIPNLPEYSLKYVLAILNSRAAQFYFKGMFSSVKVLRKHIESIPIPPCTTDMQQRIVSLVDLLLTEVKREQRIVYYERLDQILMDLYLIQPSEQNLIRETVFPNSNYL